MVTRETGFTLIELLVVVAIIAILAAILFPVFERARQKAISSSCQSNLKQLGLAFRMYMDDYDGAMPDDNYYVPSDQWPIPDWSFSGWCDPPGTEWCWQFYLWPYVKNRDLLYCPAGDPHNRWENTITSDYQWNFAGTHGTVPGTDSLPYPAQTHLVYDGYRARLFNGPPTLASLKENLGWNRTIPKNQGFRHNGMHNVAFVDGHVKSIAKANMIKNAGGNANDYTPPWNLNWSD